MMVPGNFLSHAQEGHVERIFFRRNQRVIPIFAVFLHDSEFFRSQLAGLEQDGVRDADLANVVEDGRGAEVFNEGGRDDVLERIASGESAGESPGVFADTQQVGARILVAAFCQAGQAKNGTLPGVIEDLAG